MPIYEFECESCGERFEELVGAGAVAERCPACGETRVRRRYSAPAETPKLVKTPREARKQERANAGLQKAARAQFKAKRRRAREAGKRTGGDGP